MNGIPMGKNQILSLKVTSIYENKKQVVKSGVTWHRHDVTLEDKAGNTSIKEYLTPELKCTGLVIGVYQYIKCLFPNEKGDEITPADDPFPNNNLAKAKEIANSLPRGASEGPSTTKEIPKNCYSMPLSGQSITFAMAWAKDLKVAEISKRKAGSKITDEDLEDMAKWADRINNAICERLQF